MADEMPAKPTYTVLLVDDNETILRALHNYLERKGFNLLEARDGEEALLIAECYPSIIHVLVTDLVMGRMNGGELIHRLVPLRPEMQVVIMSGYHDQIMVQHAITPLAPVLQKPFRPKKLLATIEEVLAKPESERTVAYLAQPLTTALQHAQASGA